jgi:hypothetical protein
MKKRILSLVFCAGIMMLPPAFGKCYEFPKTIINVNTQSDEIDLRGSIEPGEIRRTGSAISAFLKTSVIKSQFHFDVGTLQISITNATGTIMYNNTVSSSIGEFLIPISGLSSGNYSITFTSTSGEMTGNFVL